MVEINWTRWLVYLIVGVPALTWILLTRNNVLRVLAVLGILVFVEGTFAWRRFFIAIGVGPSVMFVYVAFMGLYFQRGRFPSLGMQGFLWLAFLFSALVGIMLGSFGTGLLFLNIKTFQEYYFEGFLFFLVGVMAFDRDGDVKRFFYRFVVLIGGGSAALHMLFLTTGWRPPALEQVAAIQRYGEFIGGAFPHSNTQADFYAMTIPAALLILLAGGVRGARRLILAAVLAAMVVSLLLTAARGGILATIVLMGVAFLLSSERLSKTALTGLVGLFLAGGASLIGLYVLPELFKEAFGYMAEEGLETERFTTWSQFLRILADHPFGIGLDPENFLAMGSRYGTGLASAHNIYLDQAVAIGIQGLIVFLALVGSVLKRVWQVLRTTHDPEAREVALYLFLALSGFLLGGVVEPIYINGYKLNQMFWLLLGVSLATSQRAVAAEREARLGLDSGAGLVPQRALGEQRADHA